MASVKGFRFDRIGGPDVLQWVDIDLGAPGPGQLRIRNTAVGGQFPRRADPQGRAQDRFASLRAWPGKRRHRRSGRRRRKRLCRRRSRRLHGAAGRFPCARHASCRRRASIQLPAAIDDRTAASMMTRGMTARYLLKQTYAVQPGDTILVHAAAGGVGLILCQWAKHLGATVIGTVGSDEKAEIARAHGCDHPIVYTREDFVARVQRDHRRRRACRWSTTRSAATTFEGSLECLRRRGIMASFGEASGEPEPMPPHRLGYLGSIFLTHPSLGHYTADARGTAGERQRPVRHGGERPHPHRDQPRLPVARGAAGACRSGSAQDHRLDRADLSVVSTARLRSAASARQARSWRAARPRLRLLSVSVPPCACTIDWRWPGRDRCRRSRGCATLRRDRTAGTRAPAPPREFPALHRRW